MNTDLVVQEAPREHMRMTNEQLKYIANTDFIDRGKRGNLPAILACVATGRELGIGDMAALKNIHVVDGSPTYSAELMVMLVRRAGHSIQGSFAEDAVTVTGKRADNGDTMSVTWTMAMATRAGLANKSNWKHYPEAMLWARAVSQLCRMLFADCFAGGTYTAEELGDETPPNEPVEEGTLTHPEGEVVDDGKFPPDDNLFIPAPQVITQDQVTRLFTIAGAANMPESELRAAVKEIAGVESTKLIPVARYDALVAVVENYAPAGTQFKVPDGVPAS